MHEQDGNRYNFACCFASFPQQCPNMRWNSIGAPNWQKRGARVSQNHAKSQFVFFNTTLASTKFFVKKTSRKGGIHARVTVESRHSHGRVTPQSRQSHSKGAHVIAGPCPLDLPNQKGSSKGMSGLQGTRYGATYGYFKHTFCQEAGTHVQLCQQADTTIRVVTRIGAHT